MATWMLIASLVLASQASTAGRPSGWTPHNVSGQQSATGITVKAPDEGFVVEIPGKSFKALSEERLLWQVDAMTVELLVAAPSALLPDAATGEEILRDYRRAAPGAGDEAFSTTSGLTGELWTIDDSAAAAAVVIGRVIVVLTVTPASAGEVGSARAYLRSLAASVRPIAETDTTAGPPQGPDPASSGATLQEQMRLMEALLGETHVGLLSAKLGTETDKRVAGAVVIGHDALVEMARFLIGIGQEALTVSIFDGRQAHAINIVGFDATNRIFEYWEPWGEGSFLERDNNAAGVSARKHATEPRVWLLTFDELTRILYSMVLPMDTVIGAFRLCTLSAGPPEKIVATYRALHDTAPELEELTAERLEKDAEYMMSVGAPEVAAALVAARVTLYPAADPLALSIDAARVRTLAASATPPAARPRPPQHLAAARGEDFFTFFNLEQTGIDGGVTKFRPTSEKFAPLVEVAITTTAAEVITARELKLDGSFISDPAISMFAGDIVNSFLAFSVDRTEAPELETLGDELWQRDRTQVPIPGARASTATVPAIPSPAYLTYIGQHPASELVLPMSVIRLRNVDKDDGRELVITVVNR